MCYFIWESFLGISQILSLIPGVRIYELRQSQLSLFHHRQKFANLQSEDRFQIQGEHQTYAQGGSQWSGFASCGK